MKHFPGLSPGLARCGWGVLAGLALIGLEIPGGAGALKELPGHPPGGVIHPALDRSASSAGQAQGNRLADAPNELFLLPAGDYGVSGPVGGPFGAGSWTWTLTNASSSALSWSLINTSSWLSVSLTNGILPANGSAAVGARLAPNVYSLGPEVLSCTLLLTNSAQTAYSLQVTLSIGQSLLANGGFESGDFSGWSFLGHQVVGTNVFDIVSDQSTNGYPARSGSYCAFLGDIAPASLSQTVPTVSGQYYLLSFWVQNIDQASGELFVLNWNTNSASSNTLYSLANPPVFPWTRVQLLLGAAETNSTLQFLVENDSSYFMLDDVSLIPIPRPAFERVSRQASSVRLDWKAQTGLVYQVQYKTNLAQAGWLNLGSGLTSTGYSASLLDTNASASNRFYRLGVGF